MTMPCRLALWWGLLFATAWTARAHVTLAAVVCSVGLVASLAVWGGVTLHRYRRVIPRHGVARRRPPDAEWFAMPDGRIVDRDGREL